MNTLTIERFNRILDGEIAGLCIRDTRIRIDNKIHKIRAIHKVSHHIGYARYYPQQPVFNLIDEK